MKCNQCVAERKMAEAELDGDVKLGKLTEDEAFQRRLAIPEMRDALTMVSLWQTQQIPGGAVMGVVAMPICYEHIIVTQKSAVQRATEGGLLLGGAGGVN